MRWQVRSSRRRSTPGSTAYRDALGLPRALTVHSERHAYVTHLTEDGADRRFIQQQVGHECDSSTAVYTNSRELHLTGELCPVSRLSRAS